MAPNDYGNLVYRRLGGEAEFGAGSAAARRWRAAAGANVGRLSDPDGYCQPKSAVGFAREWRRTAYRKSNPIRVRALTSGGVAIPSRTRSARSGPPASR